MSKEEILIPTQRNFKLSATCHAPTKNSFLPSSISPRDKPRSFQLQLPSREHVLIPLLINLRMYSLLILAGAFASANGALDFNPFFTNNCTNEEFYCGNFNCVPLSKQCDGTKDCSDGSDELDCEMITCKKPDFFRCHNARCISSSFVCDGENDCDDFSDEENCEDFKKTLGKNVTCPEGLWQCTDKLCIPQEWVCNGATDCLDGSDEVLGCSTHIDCDGFKCKNGHCVFKEWRCDGIDDCRDNSDEENCDALVDTKDCTLEKGHFLCGDGKSCIKLSHVCNGKDECPDKSDEGAKCEVGCEHCAHHCVKLPTGPRCICPDGYHTVEENRCEDINECEIYGICDQQCKNTPGSYQCLCEENYSLQSDKKSCKAHFGEATMYFSSKKEIRAYFLRSGVYFPVAKNLNQVVGVDFDGQHVYWTDILSEHETIVRALKNGENMENLVTSGLVAPEDLRVDYITKNVYFTDAGRQHIAVCTNEGRHCAVLRNEDIHKPRGIVLSPADGEMYWSDWGEKPQIARSLMDGSRPTSFVSSDIKWPNGLAIDHPNSRLYWTDAKLETIESIRLDGTDRRMVLDGIVKHPYSIAVFERRLYWSDWSTHSIQVCDKFTGKNHATLIKEQKEYIYGISIYHPNNHKKVVNPCDGALCSDICLLSGHTYTCACPQDKELGIDGHTCKELGKKQRLILGADNLLMEVEHQVLGKHTVVAMNAVVKKIGALAYNSVENALYVSDLALRKIVRVSMHTGMAKLLGVGELGEVIAMDFDYLGNNLYWCDKQRGTLEVFSLNTDSRTILLHDMGGETPESIALVPEEGVMFVAFRELGGHVSHVDRISMDGTTRTHSIESGLLGPISLCYDFTLHRIFIADAGTGNIESTSVEGDDRHGFRSLQTSPVGVTSLKSDIFWVNKHARTVFWADKFNTGDTTYNRKITLDLPEEIDRMHVVSVTPHKMGLSPCQTDNGGCSHLCLQANKKITCSCPIGMGLGADKKTCAKRQECRSDEFFCGDSNVCVPNKFRCDATKHCPHGEDEKDCKKAHCPPNYFQCQDGECIDKSYTCDNKFDCRDKSDERNCSHVVKSKCPPKHFRCEDGQCINERLVCDGPRDCKNGEDELRCDATVCREKEFRCLSGACISKDWECDHDFDCPDMSDEHAGCPKCNQSMFVCSNGKCIDRSFVCDDENDCGDHSDEINCSHLPEPCKNGEFSCSLRSLVCLPHSARCNGTAECPHHEDEQSCDHECQFDEFSCKNRKCLPREWVCDHTDDCGDASDEDTSICNHTMAQPTAMATPCQGKFQCNSGSCVDFTSVCDGKSDCFDGSDEEGVCSTACNSLNDPCTQICVKTPTGPTCRCEEGFYLLGDGKQCEDVDECSLDVSVCAQICHNIPSYYLCDCYEGFSLRADRTSCKAEGKAMSLLFVLNNQIREMSQINNSLSLVYDDDSATITGLDASSTSNTIFFSVEMSSTIVKINRTAGKTEFIEDVGQPQKLAVDYLTNNVYYANNHPMARSISVCNFEAKSCANLFDVDLHRQISAIAVDSSNRFLFYSLVSWWMFNSPSYVLFKSNLDGTDKQELVKSTAGHITGLTFDPYKKELFFADQHQGVISTIRYDGTSKRVLLSNLTRPTGLNFFENQLFFQSNSFMQKCRLYKPTTCDTFRFKSEMFTVMQNSREPAGAKACEDHKCSYLCVAAKRDYKCLCADGKLVLPGEDCDSAMREAGSDDRKRVLTVHHHEHYSSHVGAVVTGVMISICVLAVGFLLFYVVRRRNTGTFKIINMRFNNPGYGLDTDDAERSILEPGHHEYSNPVEIYYPESVPVRKEEMLVNV